MDNKKLQRIVVDALEDVKAQDIAVYNTTDLSDLFDRVVLASGTSNRHTRSLASNVAEKVKLAGGNVVSVEGGETGEWVLVDLGDVIVHIMQPAVRAYYDLEELWGGKKVNVRLAAKTAAPRKTAAKPAAKSAAKSAVAAARKAADGSAKALPGKAAKKAPSRKPRAAAGEK